MNAAMHNDLARIQRLLAQGVDVRKRTKGGETALYWAIDRRDLNEDNLPTVDALLKAGADPNELEIFLMHPLDVSLTRDYANPAVTLRLIHVGATVSRGCNGADSLLSLATMDSTIQVMQALIDSGAALNCQDKYGRTALHWAAINGEVDKVTILLRSGADRTMRTSGGQTALDAATTTNPEARVQKQFPRTRALLSAPFNCVASATGLQPQDSAA
jgi:ankyrin repeat protein